MQELDLYYMPTCPYSRKVLDYMEQNEINVRLKDTLQDHKNRAELIKIGGKSQVPCLVIDGKALYESNDIIQWFEKNWK